MQQNSTWRPDHKLRARLESLTSKLEPPVPPTRKQLLPIPSRLPNTLVEKLARDLEKAGGREWWSFMLNLGKDLPKVEEVRLDPSMVERIEQEVGGNVTKIIKVMLRVFEEQWTSAGVRGDLVEHLALVLESEEVFLPPLRRLARQLREEGGRKV